MAKKTLKQIEEENFDLRWKKYIDDEICNAIEELKDDVKKEYAIKLVQVIVFSFCGAILMGFVYFLVNAIGWRG